MEFNSAFKGLRVQRHSKRCRSDIVVHFPYSEVFLHIEYYFVWTLESVQNADI